MAEPWWTYLDEKEYRQRKATDFRTKAEDFFRQQRQPEVPTPEPEKKEGGPGGLLGGLKMVGEAGLGVLGKAQEAAEYATGALATQFYDIPKYAIQHPEVFIPPFLRGGMAEEEKAVLGQEPTERFEELPAAAQWAGRIGLDPINLIGLGVAPKAVKGLGIGAKALGMTRTATRLEKLAPIAAKAEDIAVGGPQRHPERFGLERTPGLRGRIRPRQGWGWRPSVGLRDRMAGHTVSAPTVRGWGSGHDRRSDADAW